MVNSIYKGSINHTNVKGKKIAVKDLSINLSFEFSWFKFCQKKIKIQKLHPPEDSRHRTWKWFGLFGRSFLRFQCESSGGVGCHHISGPVLMVRSMIGRSKQVTETPPTGFKESNKGWSPRRKLPLEFRKGVCVLFFLFSGFQGRAQIGVAYKSNDHSIQDDFIDVFVYHGNESKIKHIVFYWNCKRVYNLRRQYGQTQGHTSC